MSWRLEGGRAAEILLVEDNEDDVILTRLALGRLGRPVNLHHAPDGEVGLQFLRREPPWARAPSVDLVLLDLNMPHMDGRAMLAAVTADRALRRLPVVILTTSARDADVEAMYQLRCSGYVVKPLELDRFYAVIGEICSYWFGAATLPRSPPG